jgi:hypothetical protein
MYKILFSAEYCLNFNKMCEICFLNRSITKYALIGKKQLNMQNMQDKNDFFKFLVQ